MFKEGDILLDDYWGRHYLVLRVYRNRMKIKMQNLATGEVTERYEATFAFLRKVG